MTPLRMVYVNAKAAPGGDGSMERPFLTVAEAEAALDDAADIMVRRVDGSAWAAKSGSADRPLVVINVIASKWPGWAPTPGFPAPHRGAGGWAGTYTIPNSAAGRPGQLGPHEAPD